MNQESLVLQAGKNAFTLESIIVEKSLAEDE